MQESVLNIIVDVNFYLVNEHDKYLNSALTLSTTRENRFQILNKVLEQKLIDLKQIDYKTTFNNLDVIYRDAERCIKTCIKLIKIKHFLIKQ